LLIAVSVFDWRNDGEHPCEEAAVDEELLQLPKQSDLGLLVELRQEVQVKKSQEMAGKYPGHCLEAEVKYEHSDKEIGLVGMAVVGGG
jgi:hypothetical protein